MHQPHKLLYFLKPSKQNWPGRWNCWHMLGTLARHMLAPERLGARTFWHLQCIDVFRHHGMQTQCATFLFYCSLVKSVSSSFSLNHRLLLFLLILLFLVLADILWEQMFFEVLSFSNALMQFYAGLSSLLSCDFELID